MRYLIFSFSLLGLFSSWSLVLAAEQSKVNWLKSMKEYNNLSQELRNKQPLFVDLYTDWCGWCVTMDKRTYSNDSVANFLNTHFIPLKFNAETREEFSWRGVKFHFDDELNIHTFANFLTSGRAAFPTSVVILPDGKFETVAGFLQVREIERLLKFYALPASDRDFDNFNRHFRNRW